MPFVWLFFATFTHASVVELAVTPNSLAQNNYTFTVSANTTNDRTAFHVTITAKKEDIDSDSITGLWIVTHTKTREGSTSGSAMAAFKPEIPVTLKKDDRVWTADFTVPRESLKTPGLCFVFTELAHATVGGERVAMPSATFYELNLQDFAKQ